MELQRRSAAPRWPPGTTAPPRTPTCQPPLDVIGEGKQK